MVDPAARLDDALEGRYRIQRELGAGGMATVYLADDLKHQRKVAIKVLRPELAVLVGAERFLTEIRTTANLQHPHILPLFESGEADGFLWYAMPYVEGESLRERIDREKQLPVDAAVAIVAKVLAALGAAHERGIIHRDVKPANVLVDGRGEPLIADLGIALAVQEGGGTRGTETGLSLGTPYYMSPEQATGDRDPDARSDVYSVGCMLYEMLIGEPPYGGTTVQAIVGRILTAEPTPPTEARRSVPPNVEAAVLTALEKTPADRFASAAEFTAALRDEDYRHGPGQGRTGRAGAASIRSREATLWRRAAMVFGILCAVLGALLLWPASAPREREPLWLEITLDVALLGEGSSGALDRMDLSPDGRRLVYVVSGAEGQQLWIRELAEPEGRPIPETEGAVTPPGPLAVGRRRCPDPHHLHRRCGGTRLQSGRLVPALPPLHRAGHPAPGSLPARPRPPRHTRAGPGRSRRPAPGRRRCGRAVARRDGGRGLGHREGNPHRPGLALDEGGRPVGDPDTLFTHDTYTGDASLSADGRWLVFTHVEGGSPQVKVKPWPGPVSANAPTDSPTTPSAATRGGPLGPDRSSPEPPPRRRGG